jgi:hypothetical protein
MLDWIQLGWLWMITNQRQSWLPPSLWSLIQQIVCALGLGVLMRQFILDFPFYPS